MSSFRDKYAINLTNPEQLVSESDQKFKTDCKRKIGLTIDAFKYDLSIIDFLKQLIVDLLGISNTNPQSFFAVKPSASSKMVEQLEQEIENIDNPSADKGSIEPK